MKKILSKTFGLRDGEILISFLMQLYIFIIITVLLIVKPAVNALFISKLGASSLPYGYLLVAVIAVTASYFYSKAIRKFSLVKITILSLIIFSLTFLALGIILNFNFLNNFALYFYYVFVSLFAVVATSQFWIFANMVFNAREAKRIFGFIGAGAIAGGIFGGYLTSLISSIYGNEVVIFIASVLILFCIPIIQKIYKLRIHNLNIFKRKQVIANQDKLESSSVKLIAKSKHLTYVAFITGIAVIVAKLVDFQFSDFANKAFPDSDELAAFFGFWFSTFNVVALVIQLFLNNKILNRLGVSSTLLILPITIGLGSLLFLTFPELWVLIIIKGIDGSFKQSLNKSAVELSIMPIPLHIKNQAKSYIDVAVDSIATGFAGFLLIFLIKNLDLSSAYITVIVIFFVFVWILLIYKLREAYFDSFKKNIQKTLSFVNNEKENKKRENSLSDIKNVLKQGNEEAILNMFDRLKDYKLEILQKPAIDLLNHPSNKVKIAAINYLDYFDDDSILLRIEPLVHEKDDTLVYVALDYILAHSKEKEETFFKFYLDDANEYIANGAFLALAKQSENNKALGERYKLKERLEKKIIVFKEENTNIKNEEIAGLLLSIAYSRTKSQYYFIKQSLQSENDYILKFAIMAAGISSNEIFIKDLLQILALKKHRKKAIRALKSYGPKIIDFILAVDAKDEINSTIKKFIPRVVSAYDSENGHKILLKILKSNNSSSRVEASKSLKKLKRRNSEIAISRRLVKKYIIKETEYYKNVLEILTSIQQFINNDLATEDTDSKQGIQEARIKLNDALELELKKSLSIIFNLLSLVYSMEDIQMVASALKSNVKEAKINSLELLDNLIDGSLKGIVMPIVEHNVLEEDNWESSLIKINFLSELKYLGKLMQISGSNVRKLGVELIKASNKRELIAALLPIKKYRNKAVKKLAYDTYIQLLKIKD